MTLPILLLLFWYFDKLSWPIGLILGVLIWALVALMIPHRVNHKDPVNKIVQRVQAKKLQSKSIESSSERGKNSTH